MSTTTTSPRLRPRPGPGAATNAGFTSLPQNVAVRGRVGDRVFKTYGRRIVITRVPTFEGYCPSAAQRRQRDALRAATSYAQAVYGCSAAKALYRAAARTLGRQPYRLAIRDNLAAEDTAAAARRKQVMQWIGSSVETCRRFEAGSAPARANPKQRHGARMVTAETFVAAIVVRAIARRASLARPITERRTARERRAAGRSRGGPESPFTGANVIGERHGHVGVERLEHERGAANVRGHFLRQARCIRGRLTIGHPGDEPDDLHSEGRAE